MKNLLQQKSFLFDKTVAISFAKKCFLYGMIRNDYYLRLGVT
jgi:hypothetical protein